jgi:hypothetical protein
MKCLDCGNEEVFIESTKVWDKNYYQPGTDDVLDSKSIDVVNSGDPAECGECSSTKVVPSTVFTVTDLPEGYRWANEDELDMTGAILVKRTMNVNGVIYTQNEADIAVPE